MAELVTRRILAVDDESGILSTITRVLNRERYEIDAVLTPDDALELARNHTYDVFLCDMLMPHVSGVDLLGMVRSYAPALPVVIMSGYACLETEEKCLASGATVFLGKPFTPQELLEAVKRAMVKNVPGQIPEMAGAEYDQHIDIFKGRETVAR
jgi:DNA-binding NtrC family response regulator